MRSRRIRSASFRWGSLLTPVGSSSSSSSSEAPTRASGLELTGGLGGGNLILGKILLGL